MKRFRNIIFYTSGKMEDRPALERFTAVPEVSQVLTLLWIDQLDRRENRKESMSC